MPLGRAQRSLLLAATLLAGCVVQDPSTVVMCFHDPDCDRGEVCGDDHICYGNPPATTFQAQLDAPLDRLDLAPTEQPFSVTPQGDFVASFAPSITVSGRVVLGADPGSTVAAHLVFRRPSRIKGAPDQVVNVESVANVNHPDAASFSTTLLPTLPGETYSVTIYPDDTPGPDGGATLAQLVPPYRQIGFSFEADSPDVVFPLGGASSTGATKRITGRVLDSTLQVAQTDFEVRAYGRFGPLDPVEVASSRGNTRGEPLAMPPRPPGSFSIVVPANWEDDFEVRLTPLPGTAKPSIVLKKVHVADSTMEANLGQIALPSFPAATSYWVPVKGQAPEGSLEPAAGARITLRTVLTEDADRVIRYEAQGAADEHGLAEVQLIPAATGGNREYTYDVAPVLGMPHRSIWNQTLQVGPLGGVLASGAILGGRVLLSGQLFDFGGRALEGVTVQVVPSVRLVYEALAMQAFDVSTLQFPATTTSNDGRFSVWVDPEIVGVQAGYTLDFDPPANSLQPRWTSSAETKVAPDLRNGQALGDIWLPDPAYVRGTLTAPTTEPVPGAQIRLYEEIDDVTACAVLGTNKCQAPAILRAQGTANDKGGVRLILPRR